MAVVFQDDGDVVPRRGGIFLDVYGGIRAVVAEGGVAVAEDERREDVRGEGQFLCLRLFRFAAGGAVFGVCFSAGLAEEPSQGRARAVAVELRHAGLCEGHRGPEAVHRRPALVERLLADGRQRRNGDAVAVVEDGGDAASFRGVFAVEEDVRDGWFYSMMVLSVIVQWYSFAASSP